MDGKKFEWSNTMLNNPHTRFQFGDANEIRVEQQLMDELVYSYGQTVLYLPRSWVDVDTILGEDNLSEFNKAIPLPIFWMNSENWEGNQYQVQQFGLGFDVQLQFYISEGYWAKYMTYSQEGNLSNEKSRNFGNSLLGEPAVGDIIIFNPFPNTLNKEAKPMYLQIMSTHNLNISPISLRYGWQVNCSTLDYEHNTIDINVQDAQDLSNLFSNDIDIRGNDVGEDATSFGNNNDFLDKGKNKVFDPSNKFKKRQTVKVDNDYEI